MPNLFEKMASSEESGQRHATPVSACIQGKSDENLSPSDVLVLLGGLVLLGALSGTQSPAQFRHAYWVTIPDPAKPEPNGKSYQSGSGNQGKDRPSLFGFALT